MHSIRIAFCLMLATAATAQSMNVLSFNLRFPNPDDGANYWPHRKEMVASVIRFHQADIVGVQEAFRAQLDELEGMLPAFDWFGHCRTDGSLAPVPDNEFSAILYRRDRFERLDGRTFWLSPTPDSVGSVGWDAALPRVATWVKLRDRRSQQVFMVFNTHFDHRGAVAREESAKLLLEQIRQIADTLPVVLTGDFNCYPDSPPYQVLTAEDAGLADALHISQQPHHGPMATWTDGFKTAGAGGRIDFIFVGPGIRVHRHAALSESWSGRLPSDHLPVFAELSLPLNFR